jgi:methylmalonyl-CoA/ethylmalonyl-CoA epimerase
MACATNYWSLLAVDHVRPDRGYGMRLHHVGIVVSSIENAGAESARRLGLQPRTPIVFDPTQRVRVQFWGHGPGDTALEFIEVAGEGSPVARAAERGGGLNHICYEVPDLRRIDMEMQKAGAILVVAPVPAVAFAGRPIVFYYVRNIGLVEYVQAEDTGGG